MRIGPRPARSADVDEVALEGSAEREDQVIRAVERYVAERVRREAVRQATGCGRGYTLPDVIECRS